MLMELFESLKKHFTDQESLVPKRLKWNLGYREFFYWDPEKKEVVRSPIERAGNRHMLKSIDSLIAYVNQTEGNKLSRRIVWVGECVIIAEMQEGNELDIVSFQLQFSPLWLLLTKLLQSPALTQVDAIRYMRQHLSGADGALAALTAIRSMKMQRTEDFESEKTHDMSRIGKSVLQQASGAGELPEMIVVAVEMFQSLGETSAIKIWLSLDFETRKIRFEPDEVDMENARLHARVELLSRLVKEIPEHSVYEGEYRVASQPVES